MQMKQTAVEWLIEKLDKIYNIKEKFLPSDWEFLEETSKKIEKEQIIYANRDGVDMVVDKKDFISGEQYYNETYNKQ
jgi:hypothetical protein